MATDELAGGSPLRSGQAVVPFQADVATCPALPNTPVWRSSERQRNCFAERGFDGTSVRDIVARARVNQAAINYHFKSKEGLYGEILKKAFVAFTATADASVASWQQIPREQALREFVRQQLRPLLFRDE